MKTSENAAPKNPGRARWNIGRAAADRLVDLEERLKDTAHPIRPRESLRAMQTAFPLASESRLSGQLSRARRERRLAKETSEGN